MITYRKDFGLWWPDYDHKPEKCHARVIGRMSDVDIVLQHTRKRDRGIVVQAGGHAGVWPMRLAHSFETVITFEPEPALFECMTRNVERAGIKNITMVKAALGEFVGKARMRPHVSAGSWRVDDLGSVEIDMQRIDDLSPIARGAVVDAIVLDVEGHEEHALKGAAQTIATYSPVIYVELLPASAPAIHKHLTRLGYRCAGRVHSDAVYTRGVSDAVRS